MWILLSLEQILVFVACLCDVISIACHSRCVYTYDSIRERRRTADGKWLFEITALYQQQNGSVVNITQMRLPPPRRIARGISSPPYVP
jgi:hypothetical protein